MKQDKEKVEKTRVQEHTEKIKGWNKRMKQKGEYFETLIFG